MDSVCGFGQGLPVGDGAICLVGLASLVDGGVEGGERLRLVLGFVQVGGGAEAVGVACGSAGEQRLPTLPPRFDGASPR